MPTPSVSAATDAHLMARVASGDSEAFAVIYDRHKTQAYSLARRIAGRIDAAEEATQDAFISVWRNAGRYDAARGSLHAWVMALVRNRCIDLLRRERPRVVAGQWSDELLDQLPAPSSTEGQVLADEDARHAQRLVSTLPAAQREVIELAYFRGYSQQEIAIGTGVPLGTVKSRARLALTRLRDASMAGAAAPLVGG